MLVNQTISLMLDIVALAHDIHTYKRQTIEIGKENAREGERALKGKMKTSLRCSFRMDWYV